MAKRRTPAADAAGAEPPTAVQQPSGAVETPSDEPGAEVTTEAVTHAPIQAPEKGAGRAWTIDNRLGYRKEDSPDGKRRQIRFADRPNGQRPDDETLAAVREQKPEVSWTPKQKAWQARHTPEGREAIDTADQKLAELGRRRTEGQER